MMTIIVVFVVVIQPEFVCTQSGRVVHRRRTADADDGTVDLRYEVLIQKLSTANFSYPFLWYN